MKNPSKAELIAQRADLIKAMEDVIKVQTSTGIWDADPYMHGMANGMILMHSMAVATTPEFIKAPSYWKKRMYRIPRTILRHIWHYIQLLMYTMISNLTGFKVAHKRPTIYSVEQEEQ